MNTIKKILIQPKSLISIFIVTAVIVATSLLVELHQSKKEMLELMEGQGHSLLETVLTSSENALYSYEKIENELKQRLLGTAFTVRDLYRRGFVDNDFLQATAERNNILRINIFNKYGKKVFTSSDEIHEDLIEKEDPKEYLAPILNGETDTLIIGLKPARHLEGKRYAIAVAAHNRGAITLNIDAAELIDFRRQVGFGVLLKQLTENPDIVYAALQDGKGIIAGSGEVANLSPLAGEEIVTEALAENTYKWHIRSNGAEDVFEMMHPFYYKDDIVGMFKLGISLEPLNNINERLTRRIIFLGLALLVFGFVTITLIFARQNFDILSKKFKAIESYSANILGNVSDTIIVVDKDDKITSANHAGEKMFGAAENELKGKNIFNFFNGTRCAELLNSESSSEEIDCMMNGVSKVLLASVSRFDDENNNENRIFVLKDITEQKALELQIERKERMIAMGELASSVAHEIRNPLNSIGTITQQLGKDFLPTEGEEEYKSLTKLVYKEVRRINEIIQNFLNFAKPKPVKPEQFLLNDLITQIAKQYAGMIEKKNASFILKNNFDGEVSWDKAQITQALINLMENAVDAIDENGSVNISVNDKDARGIEIIVSDTGKGISRENINRIFNLYFTTKAKGSGIGLSVVQKIISDHNGLIKIESKLNEGTTFTLLLPKHYQ